MALLYYNMNCEITIGNVFFDTVNSVTCKNSINELTDVATIILPREFKQAKVNNSVKSFQLKNIRDFINEGDAVTIKIGYNNDIKTVFKGYLKDISADVPLKLECQDEMWQLTKTEKYNKSFSQVKLSELLAFVAPNYTYKLIDDINLGKFIIENSTAYEVLQALKRDYLLSSWFDFDKVLHIGFVSDFVPGNTYDININRIKSAKQLKYISKEKRKTLLKAISINSDGTKITVEKGEQGGETRTLHFANKTKQELEELAEKNYKSLNYDGYSGSLTLFGQPNVRAGEALKIIDPNYINSDREGTYLVESIVAKYNNSGYSQEAKLSLKL